jgi:hypothetical protein
VLQQKNAGSYLPKNGFFVANHWAFARFTRLMRLYFPRIMLMPPICFHRRAWATLFCVLPALFYHTASAQPPRAVLPASATVQTIAPELARAILLASTVHRVEAELIHAVIKQESGYNPRAVSPKGAQGLMQLMPETARRFGVGDVFDPVANVQGGTKYLRWLLDTFQGNLELVLAAYNAGEGAVTQYGNKIPPFAETQVYVPKVLAHYYQLKANAMRAELGLAKGESLQLDALHRRAPEEGKPIASNMPDAHAPKRVHPSLGNRTVRVAARSSNSTLIAQGTNIDLLEGLITGDAPVDERSVRVVQPPVRGGHVEVYPNGIISYTPPPALQGIDRFSVTISDELGNTSAPAEVTVFVK